MTHLLFILCAVGFIVAAYETARHGWHWHTMNRRLRGCSGWPLYRPHKWLVLALVLLAGCKHIAPTPVQEQGQNIGAIQERAAAVQTDATALKPHVDAAGEPLRVAIVNHGQAIQKRAEAAAATEAAVAREIGRMQQVEWKWENSWFAMKFWRWFWGIIATWGAFNVLAFTFTTFAGGGVFLRVGRWLITGLPAMWPAAWASRTWGATTGRRK